MALFVSPTAAAASNGIHDLLLREGYTGNGFLESLSLLMLNQSGMATIDYYLEGGVHQTGFASLTAGKVTVVDVNAALG